LSVYDKH